jgi:hypothetical protein
MKELSNCSLRIGLPGLLEAGLLVSKNSFGLDAPLRLFSVLAKMLV